MTVILTDSCSDLRPELAEKFQIHTLPLVVFISQRTYHDGVDITHIGCVEDAIFLRLHFCN